jgi:L-threonylcarbamoyladenylate synthase
MPAAFDRDRRIVILPAASPRAIEWAAEQIDGGGVIALPTDTVYGIAASLGHREALRRIYRIKGRDADKPLPVLVSSPDVVEHLAIGIDRHVELLLDRYWPGPLTVIVPAPAGMPDEVTAGGSTVGLRMPNHPLAIEVIAKAGGAIACTSANRSGEPPACDAQTVADSIGVELDLILDGGVAPGGVPSTVVSIADGRLTVHREGAIAEENLQATWREFRAAHAMD